MVGKKPTVESAKKSDEPRAPGYVARELERGLHRLGAGLAEKAHDRLAHWRQGGDLFAKRDLRFVPIIRRDVQKPIRGAFDCGDNFRVSVAGRTHGDARGEIQEAIAIDIPDFRTAAVRHDEWIIARIRRRDDCRVAFDQRARFRTRQLGSDTRLANHRAIVGCCVHVKHLLFAKRRAHAACVH